MSEVEAPFQNKPEGYVGGGSTSNSSSFTKPHGALPFLQRLLCMCRHPWMRKAIIFDSCIITELLKKTASQWELTKRASTPWAHSIIELSATCVQARPSQVIELYWFFSLFSRRGANERALILEVKGLKTSSSQRGTSVPAPAKVASSLNEDALTECTKLRWALEQRWSFQ